MSRRLSQVINSGLRALSISNCFCSQCDSESSQAGSDDGILAGPQDQSNQPSTTGPTSPGASAPSSSSEHASLHTAFSQLSVYQSAASQTRSQDDQPTQNASHEANNDASSGIFQMSQSSGSQSGHQSGNVPQHSEASEDSPGDDAASTTQMPGYKYGELQKSGEQRRQWIDNPDDDSCPIQGSSLTLHDLRNDYTVNRPTRRGLIQTLRGQVADIGLPNEFDNPVHPSVYQSWDIQENDFRWTGAMWDNMISLDDIRRETDSNAPQISEVTLALFRTLYNLDDLRYIFVTMVLNTETQNFVTSQLYSDENQLEWPVGRLSVDLADNQVWEHGTPEYDALLGTRIGKLIAYIVIGGFYRGSTRIARIVTFPTWVLGPRVNLRFDIEPVTPTAGN